MKFEVDNDVGRITGYWSSSFDDRHELIGATDGVMEFNDRFLNAFLCVVDDHFESIGFLQNIQINQAYRGQGHGKQLMSIFQAEVESKTEMDFLFAQVSVPQKGGLDLRFFYEKHGYEPLKKSNGILLMVNKGHASLLSTELSASVDYRCSLF